MKNVLILVFLLLSLPFLPAQILFSDSTQLLPSAPNYSGVCIGIADMNGDMKDDIIHLQNGVEVIIEYQLAPNEEFLSKRLDTAGTESQWALCVADIDNNGQNDLLVGGQYDGVKIYQGDGKGEFIKSFLPIDLLGLFTQGTNFVDIDNNGWVDVFACHDEADNQNFRNQGDGTFILDNSLINTVTVNPSDNSGNYASIWTDYDNDGDLDMYLSKCRQGVSSYTDPRRVNLLFQNDGNNNFTEVGASAGLDIGAQSWTADFADIDNDGDMDVFLINHFDDSQLFENNGDGTFTDISINSGLFPTLRGLFGIQVVMRDYDNDGFVDLLFSGNEHHLFLNKGDKTFEPQANPFKANAVESLAVGDLNHDGFLDVYAGYAYFYSDPSQIPDKLFLNNGNLNNFFGVVLQGDSSNRSGIGARVTLYGSWGIQVREVRSGEGYGIMNSLNQHFGLGTETEIDSLVVHWPSGIKDKVISPKSGQYFKLLESSTRPIEYDFFEVRKQGIHANLLWQTSTEKNIDYFTIQRSLDGITFQSLTDVMAKGGLNIRANYFFLDEAAYAGTSYYRLKQVNTDGNFYFSEIREITLPERENAWILGPNPSSDYSQLISLNGSLSGFTWELLGSGGRVIQRNTEKEPIAELSLDIRKLPTGNYYIRLRAEDGSWSQVLTLMKP